MSSILFLDTETSSFMREPVEMRMCSLTAILRQGAEEQVLDTLIRPDGWAITEAAQNGHGISTEQCERDGIPVEHALSGLRELLRQCDTIAAYNIEFDQQVILREMGERNEDWLGKRLVCIMRSATSVCRIVKSSGKGYKYPKLAEAYRILVGGEFDNAHTSLADTRACMAVYDKLFSEQKEKPVAEERDKWGYLPSEEPAMDWKEGVLASLPCPVQRGLVAYCLKQGGKGPFDLAAAYRGKDPADFKRRWEAECELVKTGILWRYHAALVPEGSSYPCLYFNEDEAEARGRQYGAAVKLAKGVG